LGSTNEKKDLLERALPILEISYGKEDVIVAEALNDLASAYSVLQDTKKQKELLERVLKIKEVHYGKEHIDLAKNLVDLANAYGPLGDARVKITLLARALKILEANYGKKHADVAITLNNLATAYGALGDTIKQKEVLEDALKIQEANYGKEHEEVAIILTNLGLCYLLQENLIQAKHYVEEAYNIFIKSLNCGINHHYTQNAKQVLDEINQRLLRSRKKEAISSEILEKYSVNLYRWQVETNPENWQAWLHLGDQYYEHEDLEQAIQSYSNVIVFSPENTSAHHNLACLYHVHGKIVFAEQHFKKVLTIKASAAIHCDYGFFLLKQKRYEEAAKNFIIAICRGYDGSRLKYGKLEKKLLDKYLLHEVTNDSHLKIEPFIIAHYWLIQCFLWLKDNDLKDFYLAQLIQLTQQYPSALHYRILSYEYRVVGNSSKADESFAVAISQSVVKVNVEKIQGFNFNEHYLDNLSALVEKSPSALRYRLLSYVYSAIGNEEKAQEYMALAMSLEPTPEIQTAQQKVTSEGSVNYNPTLFGGNKVILSASSNSSQQGSSAIELLLRKAKILHNVMQNKEMVEVKFIDHKLVQQFAVELHKIGISNLSMKDEPRKPNIIIGCEGKDDEYIITLTADEYNKIMRDKDAFAKLARNQPTQSQLSLTP
jgi:Tfp pilus assembly protein PilF